MTQLMMVIWWLRLTYNTPRRPQSLWLSLEKESGCGIEFRAIELLFQKRKNFLATFLDSFRIRWGQNREMREVNNKKGFQLSSVLQLSSVPFSLTDGDQFIGIVGKFSQRLKSECHYFLLQMVYVMRKKYFHQCYVVWGLWFGFKPFWRQEEPKTHNLSKVRPVLSKTSTTLTQNMSLQNFVAK